MCVCGIILHSFLSRWANVIIMNNLSLGRYVVITGSESKMLITCKFIGGFDKVVNHMFLSV